MTQRTRFLLCAIVALGVSVFSSGAPTTVQAAEFPAIADVTKGYQKVSGFINLYVNAKKHRLYGEISSRLLKRPFLLATSVSGGRYTGWQWSDQMVFLERLDRQLVLVEPEIRYRASSGTLKDVVKRTYRDRVITSIPIVGAGPGGTLLIDLKSLLAGRAYIFVGPLASGVSSSLTKIAKAKAFPSNVEIEFDMVRSSGGIGVHYSISQLPSTGYQPRVADDRIGYFLTALKDFTKDPRSETTFVRYINRWHLEKADSSLALSPPKQPIEFYVERTVPIRYRRYVHEGILEWNKAFEKIGILGAIVVHQQTSTRFNDLDPEDVRYNFFRWITSQSAFAMGPSRVHPQTGQILDADIIFDDSMIREWVEDYGRLIQKGPEKEFHPALQRYLKENPGRHPMRRWRGRRGQPMRVKPVPSSVPHGQVHVPEHEPDEDESLTPDYSRTGYCDSGHGVRHQVSFGMVAMRALADLAKAPAAKEKWPEEFIGQILKEVVMHEVGHTLGLRHNFKASSWLSLAEINKKDNPPSVITGSVMDYNPINISQNGKPQGVWNTRGLGPYDFWAIEYGYAFKSGADLAKVASRVAEKGLAYATDEDTWSSDPLVNRFDMGKDPLEYGIHRMELASGILKSLVKSLVKPGQGYQRARQAFDMLLYEYMRSARMAARFIGGHYIHRDHKGDPNERPPVQPVSAEQQWKALDLICKYIFSKDAFQFPPELLNYLAVGRWYHWGSSDMMRDPEYPIHDRLLQIQLWSLFDVLNPQTLTLVADSELRVKDDKDHVTLPALLNKLTTEIWSEVMDVKKGSYTNRKPMIRSLRRNLQHEFIDEMVKLALEDEYGMNPQTARTQAWYQLRALQGKIRRCLDDSRSSADLNLDDYTAAHLEETAQRIGEALKASYSRNGGNNGGGGFLLFFRENEKTGEPGEER